MPALRTFQAGLATVVIHPTADDLAEAVAARVATLLAEAITDRGLVRVIIGTGPSQAAFIAALVARADVRWDRVEVFHMDEYLGMPVSHPASFRRWLRDHLTERVQVYAAHELAGDAPDAAAEARRYAGLLASAPIDISCVGFGENGHLAFNDPPVADFTDAEIVKPVELDLRCRLQQVGEGHFASVDAAPALALTVTIPTLLGARTVVACVPDRRKADAVRDALEGPISTACPASIVRTHPHAFVHLDAEAAALLGGTPPALPGPSPVPAPA